MNKSVLVTLADKNYIDQAKQLFSSVYWNAGWKGDYLLLAHEVPEEDLAWFREKGILIRHCSPVYDYLPSPIQHATAPQRFYGDPIPLSKFYLFTAEFKKWDNVVFVDADIIVRYSLEGLSWMSGFHAVSNINAWSLKEEFLPETDPADPAYVRLKKEFELDTPAFNSGVMAFSTDIIREDSFDMLNELFISYGSISRSRGDQHIFNLFFYRRWKRLNFLYNLYASFALEYYDMPTSKIDGVVLHMLGDIKPWDPRSGFYDEWKTNLKKADLMDLNKKGGNRRIFPKTVMVYRSLLFYSKKGISRSCRRIDRQIGLFGLKLKSRYPKIYSVFKGPSSS